VLTAAKAGARWGLGGTAEDVPFPFMPSLCSKSRSALGIERLHVNADMELMSSTAQD
jgi:hypothetical protein